MLLKKYSVPTLFFIVGLIVIIIGITKNQDATFMMAAVLLFAAALLSILYSTGKLTTKIAYVVGIVAGIGALVAFYMSGDQIIEMTQYLKDRDQCKALAIQNLQDIRTIQKNYAEQNGVYIDNWDDLIDFTKNGKINYVEKKGQAPDTFMIRAEHLYLVEIGLHEKGHPYGNEKISEIEAYHFSKWPEGPNYERFYKDFVRDTTPASLLERLFENESYVRSREVAGFPTFSPDSLPFIPFTGAREKWLIETADSVMMGDVKVPALRVSGTLPFAELPGRKRIKMHFGSLTTNDLDGSWEE